MKKLVFCFALLTFFVSCEPAVKSDHLSSISVWVFEAGTSNPIDSAKVFTNPVCGKNGNTDTNGNYLFQDIKVGSYSVYASKVGYETNGVLTMADAGEVATVYIELEKTDDKKDSE